jgi:hypothetical protein
MAPVGIRKQSGAPDPLPLKTAPFHQAGIALPISPETFVIILKCELENHGFRSAGSSERTRWPRGARVCSTSRPLYFL